MITRLSGAHGQECKKTIEENRMLRDEVDKLN